MLILAALLLALFPAVAAPAAYWQLDDGAAGATAASLVSEVNATAISAAAGVQDEGVPPAFDPDVPGAAIWDGSTLTCANPENRASLRFTNAGLAGQRAPAGSLVTVRGPSEVVQPPALTVEAFVRIERPLAHHLILISQRRRAFSGCTWSLAVDPKGALQARFDTQEGETGKNGVDWNQNVAGGMVADGQWHHVALTYDATRREARLFVDHAACGSRTTKAARVYDDAEFILGRGLDGLLDEVRLTPEVLHPEQFLRTTRFFSDLRPAAMVGGVALDQTPTRVQTGLALDWPLLGTLRPGIREGVGTSRWTLGCETLDRDLADWDAYQGYLQPLGIQRIRLQGGWARTEREKGVYTWEWLDRVVDRAHELGLTVCLETSYGNRLYQPDAGLGPGGPLPEGEECLAAWDRWVEAMVTRYKARGVHAWMMYNEPNLRRENTVDRITALNVRTAETIRRIDLEAEVAGLVSSGVDLGLIRAFLEGLRDQGKLGLFHWLVYHSYSANPDTAYPGVEKLQALVREVAPGLRLWQGEAGCASEEVQYALSGVAWTELSQAKWNARRMLGDLGHDIESAVFTISDLSYQKDFISRYGLLKTNSDNSLIKVKTAYYAVQNLVSVFNDALARQPDYALEVEADRPLTWSAYRDQATGLDLLTIWDGTGVPGNGVATIPASLTLRNAKLKEPVWLDLLTGRVYAIPAEQVSVEGATTRLTGVPVYDSPVVITDRSLLVIVPARKKP